MSDKSEDQVAGKAKKPKAVCMMPNCRRQTSPDEAFCSKHRERHSKKPTRCLRCGAGSEWLE